MSNQKQSRITWMMRIQWLPTLKINTRRANRKRAIKVVLRKESMKSHDTMMMKQTMINHEIKNTVVVDIVRGTMRAQVDIGMEIGIDTVKEEMRIDIVKEETTTDIVKEGTTTDTEEETVIDIDSRIVQNKEQKPLVYFIRFYYYYYYEL
jgi:hypothetical protein